MASRRDREPRTYTYRIPLDDTAANVLLQEYQRKDEYFIYELSDRDVPNRNAVKNWGVKFYQSKERWDHKNEEFEGGTISGLEDYRHSLAWKPTPETELLEMKRAQGGATRIRGEQHYGNDDPRIPNYVSIETTVPWTPGEVRDMFEGKAVPNRADYHHDPPMMEADMARAEYRRIIDAAKKDSYKEYQQEVREMEDECDHDRSVETRRGGYCEDCQKDWPNEREMMEDGATIVGTA